MNGLLSYDGIFYECKFRGHQELAKKLMDEHYNDEYSSSHVDYLKEIGWIYFGDNIGTNDSYVFLGNGSRTDITELQYKWFLNNKDTLTKNQVSDFEGLLLLNLCEECESRIYKYKCGTCGKLLCEKCQYTQYGEEKKRYNSKC